MSTSRVLSQNEVLPAVADPERLAVLEQTGLLEDAADPTLDRLARLAAVVVGAPVSFVSLVGVDRQVMPGSAEPDGGEVKRDMPLAESFCQYSVATGEPLVIPDTRRDPLVRGSGAVARGEILAYAGIPLSTDQGHVLGSLCVLDRRPREWEEGQLALLRDLAALVQLEIQHRLTAGRILGVQGLGRRVADGVESLGDSLTSLVELAEQQENPRLPRYAAVTRSRFTLVGELARDLRSASLPEEAHVATRPQVVDLRKAVQRAVSSVRAVTQSEAISTAITSFPLTARCEPLGLERSVSHVVLTALHHGGPASAVEVRLAPSGDLAESAQQPLVAELTVVAPGSRVPAAELGRVVARFHAGSCEDSGGPEAAPARIRVSGGVITAVSGGAQAHSSRDGSTFRMRWHLDSGPRPATITLP